MTLLFATAVHAQRERACERFVEIDFTDLQTALKSHAAERAETRFGPRLDLSCHNIRRTLIEAEEPGFLRGKKLEGIDFTGAVLVEVDLSKVQMSDSLLVGANLAGAELAHARIWQQDLSRANLAAADLTGASLLGAKFTGADLTGANLSGASLSRSDLTAAWLVNTNLEGADLFGATLAHSIWQPRGQFDRGNVGNLRGVRSLRVNLCESSFGAPIADCETPVAEPDFSGLNHLIETLSQAGHRQAERDATAAREEMRNDLMVAHFLADPLSNFTDGVVAIFRRLLFDIPVDYGTRPFGALWGLMLSWILFGAAYTAALRIAPRSAEFALYESQMEGRIVLRSLRKPPYRAFVRAGDAEVTRLHPATLPQAVKHGALFSLAMVFRVGFRDVNVGEWVSRLRANKVEYVATGYLRTLAGVQSLISLYLLAIFLLTFFGRPFQ
ncbi:pentapeptide repeat-containing protein [Primorskyibacter sedentarius]|nr:pentapeptide repeat-containing protein [Primorskyibacter sedentarius]